MNCAELLWKETVQDRVVPQVFLECRKMRAKMRERIVEIFKSTNRKEGSLEISSAKGSSAKGSPAQRSGKDSMGGGMSCGSMSGSTSSFK